MKQVLELDLVGCGTVVVAAALGYDGKGWQAISARETSILNGGVINGNGGRLRFPQSIHSTGCSWAVE